MSFLEGLYMLPRNLYHHPRPLELRKVVRGIVVGAHHRIQSEPPPRELSRRSMLVVEATIVLQHLVPCYRTMLSAVSP